MLLLTGFEPFGGLKRNPTGDIARLLGQESGVEGAVLPVDYRRIGGALEELLAHEWDAVVLLGVAVLRPSLSLEKVAINFCDPERPDNAGYCPADTALVSEGPRAYFSTLPLDRLLDGLREEGVAAEISYTAGPYLCNAAMYLARHRLDAAGVPCGFIHMPPTPDLAASAAPMEFETQVRGVRRVLAELGR